MHRILRALAWFVLFVVLLTSLIGVFEWWRSGPEELRQLNRTLAATPEGGVLDLGTIFDIEWDRVVICPGYTSAASVNALLGSKILRHDEFSLADDNEWAFVFLDGDKPSLILAHRSSCYAIYWIQDAVVIPRHEARFTVHEKEARAILGKVE